MTEVTVAPVGALEMVMLSESIGLMAQVPMLLPLTLCAKHGAARSTDTSETVAIQYAFIVHLVPPIMCGVRSAFVSPPPWAAFARREESPRVPYEQ